MFTYRLLRSYALRFFRPTVLVREQYEAFRNLLEQEQQAHQAMTRLEKIYHDRLPADSCTLKRLYRELLGATTKMSDNLRRMAPLSHRNLAVTLRSIDSKAQESLDDVSTGGSEPPRPPMNETPTGEPEATASRVLWPHRLDRTLLSGGERAASGIAVGRVALLQSSARLKQVPYGAILVACTTLPRFTRMAGKIRGIVTDEGPAAGTVATVARETGIPCLVNTGLGTRVLEQGAIVTLDADQQVVFQGVATELLEPFHNRQEAPPDTPWRNMVRRLLDAVSPLNLLDPDDPGFVIENCRTLHDILRFVREAAVREMFDLGEKAERGFWRARKFSGDFALVNHVIDLGGGLSQSAIGKREITPDDISSLPFRALWKGFIQRPEPDLRESLLAEQWPVDRFTYGHGVSSPEPHSPPSHALVSRDYMNARIRIGRYFTTIDALIGPISQDNYVSLAFNARGRGLEGNPLRALWMALVLENLGFDVRLSISSVRATFEGTPADALVERLREVGRLLAFTPVLDMALTDLSQVSRLTAVFCRSPAQPDPLLPKPIPNGESAECAGSVSRDDVVLYRPNWLTDHLAVGYAPLSEGELESIKRHGIRAIVNLCAEIPDLHRMERDLGFEVFYLPVRDNHIPKLEDMEEALAWMDEALYLEKKVLIHCRLGIGRSGTFLRAYLLRRGFGLELTEKRLKHAHSLPTSKSQWAFLLLYSGQSRRLTVRKPSIEHKGPLDLGPYIDAYEVLCREVDASVGEAAKGSAVERRCCGSETDACCKSPFHLQFLEAVHLWHCVNRELSREERTAVTRRAVQLNTIMTGKPVRSDKEAIHPDGGPDQVHKPANRASEAVEYVCPLSSKGQCLLFSQRPIRCRFFIDDNSPHPPSPAAGSSPDESQTSLTLEEAGERLSTLSKSLLSTLNGSPIQSRSFCFPVTQVLSGRFMEDYFTWMKQQV